MKRRNIIDLNTRMQVIKRKARNNLGQFAEDFKERAADSIASAVDLVASGQSVVSTVVKKQPRLSLLQGGSALATTASQSAGVSV